MNRSLCSLAFAFWLLAPSVNAQAGPPPMPAPARPLPAPPAVAAPSVPAPSVGALRAPGAPIPQRLGAPIAPHPHLLVVAAAVMPGAGPGAARATEALAELGRAFGYQVSQVGAPGGQFGAAMSPAEIHELVGRWGASIGLYASLAGAPGAYRVQLLMIHADQRPALSPTVNSAADEFGEQFEAALGAALPDHSTRASASSSNDASDREYSLWRLAARSESAIGVGAGSFYNHLLEARLDRRFSFSISAGASVAYVNLKDRSGRGGNLLPQLQFEKRIGLDDARRFEIPFRVSSGYLPQNGPVMRGGLGLDFALSDSVDVVVDLAGMLWLIRSHTVSSVNLGIELGFAL